VVAFPSGLPPVPALSNHGSKMCRAYYRAYIFTTNSGSKEILQRYTFHSHDGSTALSTSISKTHIDLYTLFPLPLCELWGTATGTVTVLYVHFKNEAALKPSQISSDSLVWIESFGLTSPTNRLSRVSPKSILNFIVKLSCYSVYYLFINEKLASYSLMFWNPNICWVNFSRWTISIGRVRTL